MCIGILKLQASHVNAVQMTCSRKTFQLSIQRKEWNVVPRLEGGGCTPSTLSAIRYSAVRDGTGEKVLGFPIRN
jgi:hypothetical protein